MPVEFSKVIIAIDDTRTVVDGRVFTIAVDCGCFQHQRDPVFEIAVSPGGRLLGMRALASEPFSSRAQSAQCVARIDPLATLPTPEDTERDKQRRIERAKAHRLRHEEAEELKRERESKK